MTHLYVYVVTMPSTASLDSPRPFPLPTATT